MTAETRDFLEMLVTMELSVVAFLVAVSAFLFSKTDPFEPENNNLLLGLVLPLMTNTTTVLVSSVALALSRWGCHQTVVRLADFAGALNVAGVLAAVAGPGYVVWKLTVRNNQERKLDALGGRLTRSRRALSPPQCNWGSRLDCSARSTACRSLMFLFSAAPLPHVLT